MRESANITLADINRLIEENESMQAEIDRLKAALREIEPLTQTCYEAADIARAALEGKT